MAKWDINWTFRFYGIGSQKLDENALAHMEVRGNGGKSVKLRFLTSEYATKWTEKKTISRDDNIRSHMVKFSDNLRTVILKHLENSSILMKNESNQQLWSFEI